MRLEKEEERMNTRRMRKEAARHERNVGERNKIMKLE